MKALVLAAGMGERLGKQTASTPKAMLEIAGIRLIDHTLAFLNHPSIEEIGVVGGYKFEQVAEHLSRKNLVYPAEIKIFKNDDYMQGNILTLQAAADFIDNDILICNVDHIYPDELLDHIIRNAKGLSAMCDTDRRLGDDDMKVKLNTSGMLKKISKTLADFDAGYIGMTYCSKEMNETYKAAISAVIDIYGKGASVEFILGHLAANNVDINICYTSGFRWFEIDTPEDIKVAEKYIQSGGI